MNAKADFYRYSENEAKNISEIDRWRESHIANIECARYIDSSETGLMAVAYKDNRVDSDHTFRDEVIEKFGYQRTMCVLASTINAKHNDGRISQDSKQWADYHVYQLDRSQTRQYLIDNVNPGALDIFTRSVRQAYNELELYTAEHCIDDSRRDLSFENRVLVVSPEKLREDYWQPENQIFLGRSGFGCDPNASGRAVYGTYLIDGEKTRRNRADFIGVMKDECIPDWAKEKIMELSKPNQSAEQNKNGFENGIRIMDELIVEDDHINAYVETWFDVNERFGLSLDGDDSLDLYADYYPADGRLDVNYIIKYADDNRVSAKVTEITDAERDAIMKCMRENGLDECISEMEQQDNSEEMEMSMQ